MIIYSNSCLAVHHGYSYGWCYLGLHLLISWKAGLLNQPYVKPNVYERVTENQQVAQRRLLLSLELLSLLWSVTSSVYFLV